MLRFYVFLNKLYLYTENKTLLHTVSLKRCIMLLIDGGETCLYFWLPPLGGSVERPFDPFRRREEDVNKHWRGDGQLQVLVKHGVKTLPGNMDVGICLRLFDGQSKLLVKSLLSGTSGAHIALGVFRRQQRSGSGASLSNFINTLCQDEITISEAQPVTV